MVDQKENILTMSHLRTFDELPQLGPVFRHPLHLDRKMRRKSVFVIEVIPESLRTAAGQTLVDSIGTSIEQYPHKRTELTKMRLSR